MNELINADSNAMFSSIEFLKVINLLRVEAGQNEMRNNVFLTKIEDEIDDLNVYKTFVNDKGAPPQKYYDLNIDQMTLIGMRESKEIRKSVLAYLKKLKSNQLPQTYAEALRALAQETEEAEKTKLLLETANDTIITNKPKVVFADSVTGSNNSILIRQFAKDLCDDNFSIGQNRLFEWFRDNKYLNSNNEPYQNYIDLGVFEVITRTVGSGGGTFTRKTTKITGKGQTYFTEKIKNVE